MTWQRIKDIWHAFRNNIVVKVLLYLYKFINFVLRVAILALILYSAAFTIVASIVLYKGFVYVYDLYDSVESLKDSQPEMSKYMEALKDSNPNIEIKHTFVKLDSISPYLQKAVIASEDAGFYFHPGFDVYAIAEALNPTTKSR
jgi:monofunctional biosynthetic peptidoglycan transglycosylase